MKKVIGSIVLFLCVSFFSSVALADVAFNMEGEGNTAEAIKAFNKAVAFNDGTVDNNSQTEFSSAGIFRDHNGERQAKMFVEENNGKINVRVSVSSKDKGKLGSIFGMDNSTLTKISLKIKDSMKKAGYVNVDEKQ